MLDPLLRLLMALGETAAWIGVFAAAVVGAFVLYVGVALCAALFTARTPDDRAYKYKILLRLLSLFQGRRK